MKILFLEESNHLSWSEKPLVIGGWVVSQSKMREINNDIKEIKLKHGIKPLTEIKWTKIGKNKIECYKELIDYAMNNDSMQLRVLIAKRPQVMKLSYKNWYIRLHYSLTLKSPIKIEAIIADKKGVGNESILNDTIEMSLNQPVLEFLNSQESQILQLSDLFLGAIASHDFEIESPHKKEIYNKISQYINMGVSTSIISKQSKYNLFYWGDK